jgi:hypothetical protein
VAENINVSVLTGSPELCEKIFTPENMSKRKRTVEADVVSNKGGAVQLKKKKENAVESGEKQKKPEAVVVAPIPPSKPEAIRIVVGSYEKVLCGIDARFTSKSEDEVPPGSVEPYGRINST